VARSEPEVRAGKLGVLRSSSLESTKHMAKVIRQ
jgi:hypothetical protein